MATLLNMTRLEAINIMIGTIGLSPINSLSGTLTADITASINMLDEVCREVQSEGWHFNMEKDYPLSPDGNNEILWPESFASLNLEPENNIGNLNIIKRNGKVYDKRNRSYTFTTTQKFTVTVYIEWTDLPQAARNYITIKAARRFADRMVGSGDIHSFTQEDEMTARSTLADVEAEDADYSIFDHYDTAAPLMRSPHLSYMD